MSTDLGIAVLGAGFIADLHARAARSCSARLVVVAARDAERAAAFGDSHGFARSTTDWAEAVTDPGVDLVVIGTPNALHHPQAMAAIAAGKHVLVDKPMAMTVAQADEMIAAAGAAGTVLAVGHMWRYRDEVIRLRDRVAAGDLGRVVRTRGYGIHAGWRPSGWFVDPALSGGGALIDMGIHAIDTARFLLGDPDPVRVVASIGNGFDPTHGLDDDGVVLIDWSNGTRSVVECGWSQPVLDGVEAETDVYATAGHARIWPGFTATTPPPDGYEHCAVDMYAAQMADVLACCSSGGTPVASAEVGRTALAITQAAMASSAELGRPAELGRSPAFDDSTEVVS